MSNIAYNAKLLRQNQTVAENILWEKLRAKRFYGFKFRRQHIFDVYIVDFVCIQLRLIIEVDGEQHKEQQDYDMQRSAHLNSIGYTVIRFSNHEVIKHTARVLAKITQHICKAQNFDLY